MVQSLIPFTTTLVDREKKDEDLEPGDDLPEMMYEHTYQLFFANQEDHDRALNILRTSSLVTKDKYSIQFQDQDSTNDPKPWRSPERKRD